MKKAIKVASATAEGVVIYEDCKGITYNPTTKKTKVSNFTKGAVVDTFHIVKKEGYRKPYNAAFVSSVYFPKGANINECSEKRRTELKSKRNMIRFISALIF